MERERERGLAVARDAAVRREMEESFILVVVKSSECFLQVSERDFETVFALALIFGKTINQLFIYIAALPECYRAPRTREKAQLCASSLPPVLASAKISSSYSTLHVLNLPSAHLP